MVDVRQRVLGGVLLVATGLALSWALELRPRIYGLDVSGIADGSKWGEAVLVGTMVYAAPVSADSILVVNTQTEEIGEGR